MEMEARPAQVAWQSEIFDNLSPADLYAAMQLRQRVFVVEQTCAYLDADGSDSRALHLFGWQGEGRERRLVAYARIFPPRVKYAEASIGRVATHPDVRGSGLGKALMREAIRVAEAEFGKDIRIAAQMYLERFYEGFGFSRVSDPYLEDDIWHVDMRRG
jgi:ElaA protein